MREAQLETHTVGCAVHVRVEPVLKYGRLLHFIPQSGEIETLRVGVTPSHEGINEW